MKKMTLIALAALSLSVGCSSGEEDETEHEHHEIDTTGTDSIVALTGDATSGESLYGTNCTSCHAADGSGGIGPSLIDVADELSDAELAGAIRNGVDDGMPAFSSLSDQDIADIMAYVKTL